MAENAPITEKGPCEPCYWAFLQEDGLWYLKCPVCGTEFPTEDSE